MTTRAGHSKRGLLTLNDCNQLSKKTDASFYAMHRSFLTFVSKSSLEKSPTLIQSRVNHPNSPLPHKHWQTTSSKVARPSWLQYTLLAHIFVDRMVNCIY